MDLRVMKKFEAIAYDFRGFGKFLAHKYGLMHAGKINMISGFQKNSNLQKKT
jgi:hypothetical protein